MSEIKRVERSLEEVKQIFEYNVSMLRVLCSNFDEGRTEFALLIAVVLRTLLCSNDKKGNKSIFDQMINNPEDKKNITFISTSFRKPKAESFMQGWEISNISNTIITSASVFTGLLIKKMAGGVKHKYEVDVEPMIDRFSEENRNLTLDCWLNEIIFADPVNSFQLTRLETIKIIADTDGGAHLDEKIPIEYVTFRKKDLFKIKCNGESYSFSRNPVYVSLRQIAYEVLESFKQANLL